MAIPKKARRVYLTRDTCRKHSLRCYWYCLGFNQPRAHPNSLTYLPLNWAASRCILPGLAQGWKGLSRLGAPIRHHINYTWHNTWPAPSLPYLRLFPGEVPISFRVSSLATRLRMFQQKISPIPSSLQGHFVNFSAPTNLKLSRNAASATHW